MTFDQEQNASQKNDGLLCDDVHKVKYTKLPPSVKVLIVVSIEVQHMLSTSFKRVFV